MGPGPVRGPFRTFRNFSKKKPNSRVGDSQDFFLQVWFLTGSETAPGPDPDRDVLHIEIGSRNAPAIVKFD